MRPLPPVRLGPPCRRPILNATTSPLYVRRCTRLPFLVQCAFLQRINETDHEDYNETEHATEDGPPIFVDVIPIRDGPRIHEDDLDIEEDEQHRDQVEFHAKARLRFSHRQHPAFIGRILNGVAFTNPTYQHADK